MALGLSFDIYGGFLAFSRKYVYGLNVLISLAYFLCDRLL
jgi:hypothetical protein